MNKKALYSVLSVIVAMIVLSVTLVLAVGPHISADSDGVGVLDKAEYFEYDTFPDGVRSICGLSFEGEDYARQFNEVHIVFPQGTTSVGAFKGSMFRDMRIRDKITNVVLPDTLQIIYDNAFYGCEFLSRINIPDGVTYIGDEAFYQCENLKNVFIPASVETIGAGAFDGSWHTVFCEGEYQNGWNDNWREYPTKEVESEEYYHTPDYWYSNTRYGCKTDGEFIYQVTEGKDFTSCAVVAYLGNQNEIVLPSEYDGIPVTIVPEGAFARGYENIAVITISDSITTIEDGAFANTGIETIIIPSNVTNMGEAVFMGCDNLATINCEASSKPDGWNSYWDFTWGWTNWYECEVPEGVEPHPDTNGWEDTDDVTSVFGYVVKYNVTFDTDGGNTINSVLVAKGSTVTAPTAPVKDGYEFKGWYNGDAIYSFSTPVTADITLTAHWEEVQPEPTEPENPETPTEQENEVTVTNEDNKQAVALGIAGGSVAGLGSISAVAAAIVARRRRK